jgi:quercetin dioxygenase-like cupin family protein
MQTRSMIVKSQDVQPLNVLGTQVRFLCKAESTDGAWSLMEVTLPIDSGPPPHTHEWDEGYFVVAGAVQFSVGAERFTARAGEFVYTPGGVAHGFRGSSAEPAKLLIFDAPAHAGTFFKRVDREVRRFRPTCRRCSASAPRPASTSCSRPERATAGGASAGRVPRATARAGRSYGYAAAGCPAAAVVLLEAGACIGLLARRATPRISAAGRGNPERAL